MSDEARPVAHVIGDPIAQSKSPTIHGFWLEQLGIEGSYEAVQVRADNLAEYVEKSVKLPGWRGCNVTMPHKQTIIQYLDSIDPLAQRLGAVNTVVKQSDGSLRGFNTDVAGFLEPLQPILMQNHLFRMARILGTGGAARAIAAGLADHHFVLVMAGRSTSKASDLIADVASQIDHHVASLAHFAEPTDFEFDDREGCLDLIVNASPLGMNGQEVLRFDFSHAPPGSIVYDIVTDPVETEFLSRAKNAGFRTIDGITMLIGQAAAAFALFFGTEPPRDQDSVLRKRIAG